jgi:hypothetical protein
VGIVGAGWIARDHRRVLDSVAEAKLVAVCDVDSERAKTLAAGTGARTYMNWRAAVACTPADAAGTLAVAAAAERALETSRAVEVGTYWLRPKPPDFDWRARDARPPYPWPRSAACRASARSGVKSHSPVVPVGQQPDPGQRVGPTNSSRAAGLVVSSGGHSAIPRMKICRGSLCPLPVGSENNKATRPSRRTFTAFWAKAIDVVISASGMRGTQGAY